MRRFKTWVEQLTFVNTLVGLPSLVLNIIQAVVLAVILGLAFVSYLSRNSWWLLPTALLMVFFVAVLVVVQARPAPRAATPPEPKAEEAPQPRPAPADRPRPSSTRTAVVTDRRTGLREVLQRDLDQGVNIRDRLPNYRTGDMTWLLGLSSQGKTAASQADVDHWIKMVEVHLASEPRHLANFRLPVRTPIHMLVVMSGDPAIRQMDHKLARLEGIIKAL